MERKRSRSAKQLREALGVLRDLGVKSYDPATGAVEFFPPHTHPTIPAPPPNVVERSNEEARRRRHDEAMLFASVEGFPSDEANGEAAE